MKDQALIDMDEVAIVPQDSATLMAHIIALQQALKAKEKHDNLRVLRIAAVEEKTGRKKSSIYAAVRAGTFPPPISLGGRASGWLSADIDDWLEQQIRASRSRKTEIRQ